MDPSGTEHKMASSERRTAVGLGRQTTFSNLERPRFVWAYDRTPLQRKHICFREISNAVRTFSSKRLGRERDSSTKAVGRC